MIPPFSNTIASPIAVKNKPKSISLSLASSSELAPNTWRHCAFQTHSGEVAAVEGVDLSLARGRTMVIVSHRLSSLVHANSILVLDGEEHLRERRLLQTPFHAERMRAFRTTVAEMFSIHRRPGKGAGMI